MTVTIAGLGALENLEFDWLFSEQVQVPALGAGRRFIVAGYEPSVAESLAASVESFLALTSAELTRVAEGPVWAYYRDFAARYADEPGFPSIPSVERIWDFVTFGEEIWIRRSDEHWYVSVENECAWEPEHGLELVFEDGQRLVKVGQVDGHPTNQDAYDDDSIPDEAVYWSPF